ncbi:unnamed protein product [Porites lobata]|uniref:Neurotransmitter-gated ion-channel ligand-binding domain-containing protein n=1 Tax=Porites lobata TaxID=104759 RepID=A0ABN8P120_9CNID|nr:unnamed protein product [Porites lobata]
MDVVRCLHAGGNISHKRMEDDEERLFNHLFENYNPRLRPVLKKSEAVNVTFGISLHQIIDVDEKNQLLQTSLWIRQVWHNPFLAWNKSQFGGIKSINVKAFEVWTPDIYLYNNANNERGGGMDQFKTQIVINSSGWNIWLSPAIIISSCKMDVKYFPFDTQVKFIFVLVKHDKSIGIRIESLSPKYDIGQQKRSIFDKLEEGYYPVIPCNTLLFYDRNTKCLGNILSSMYSLEVLLSLFVQQFCLLKFGSWTYDTFRVNIVREVPFAETDKFVGNGE